MRRKEERNKQGQTNNKAKQHSTPKSATGPILRHSLQQSHNKGLHYGFREGLKEWQTLLSFFIAINNNYNSHTDWYIIIYIQ